MSTTQHTCGGPVFGRKTAGCPRCDELLAGAAPVKWRASRAQQDALNRECAEKMLPLMLATRDDARKWGITVTARASRAKAA